MILTWESPEDIFIPSAKKYIACKILFCMEIVYFVSLLKTIFLRNFKHAIPSKTHDEKVLLVKIFIYF